MPANVAKSLPAHWPFGVPTDDSSAESTTSSQEEAEDSEGEGLPLASPMSISVQQDDIAQHALNALNRADLLNRGQSFRLVPGFGQTPGGTAATATAVAVAAAAAAAKAKATAVVRGATVATGAHESSGGDPSPTVTPGGGIDEALEEGRGVGWIRPTPAATPVAAVSAGKLGHKCPSGLKPAWGGSIRGVGGGAASV